MKDHTADVTLASPLKVGANNYVVLVQRPRGGRAESVNVAIPIAYRIRPDLTLLDTDRPTLRIAVESTPSTSLRISGSPVSLDGSGRANFDVDVAKECSGQSDDPAVLEKSIPYEATTSGRTEKSVVSVRVPIPALRVDAPNPYAIVQGDTVLVAGRAARGSRITIGGQPLAENQHRPLQTLARHARPHAGGCKRNGARDGG